MSSFLMNWPQARQPRVLGLWARRVGPGRRSPSQPLYVPTRGLHRALYAGVPAPYWVPPRSLFPLEPPVPASRSTRTDQAGGSHRPVTILTYSREAVTARPT